MNFRAQKNKLLTIAEQWGRQHCSSRWSWPGMGTSWLQTSSIIQEHLAERCQNRAEDRERCGVQCRYTRAHEDIQTQAHITHARYSVAFLWPQQVSAYQLLLATSDLTLGPFSLTAWDDSYVTSFKVKTRGLRCISVGRVLAQHTQSSTFNPKHGINRCGDMCLQFQPQGGRDRKI